MIQARKYERRGLLAIDPKAFFEIFFGGDAARENTECGGAVIVDVCGPLEQHKHPYWDSYEEIAERVDAACRTSARAVVLRVDSPGGDVAGCFETAERLRAMCDAAGKGLFAYVNGSACSAAYALACRAQSITMSMTSLVGSIGVLSCREDYSAYNLARGLRVALVTSGARKADGHPDAPITDAELAQTQVIVDSMAQMFWDMVALGRGLTAEAVAQLEAKVFHGSAAVAAGLADQVGTLDELLAMIAGAQGGTNMAASQYEKAKEALTEAAKGDDANAAAAKRALAAMEEGGAAPAAESDEPKPDDEEKPAESAEAEPPAEDPEKKKEPAAESAAAAAHRAALKAQKTADDLRAELTRRDQVTERADLIASRTDLSDDMIGLLQKAPMALVREHIASLPASGKRVTLPARGAAATARAPLSGEHAGARASQLPPTEKAALDAKMGLTDQLPQVEQTEYKLTLSPKPKPRTLAPAPNAGAAPDRKAG